MKSTHRKTYKLLQEKKTPEQVAEHRNLQLQTIVKHVKTMLKKGYLSDEDIRTVITEREEYFIEKAIGEADSSDVREILSQLEQDVSPWKVEFIQSIQGEVDEIKPSSGSEPETEPYQLISFLSETCGDYGGVNKDGWPCGSIAGTGWSVPEGRCRYHKNQDPVVRPRLVKLKLKIFRLVQKAGLATLIGSSRSDDVSPVRTAISIFVIILVFLGIILSYVQ